MGLQSIQLALSWYLKQSPGTLQNNSITNRLLTKELLEIDFSFSFLCMGAQWSNKSNISFQFVSYFQVGSILSIFNVIIFGALIIYRLLHAFHCAC